MFLRYVLRDILVLNKTCHKTVLQKITKKVKQIVYRIYLWIWKYIVNTADCFPSKKIFSHHIKIICLPPQKTFQHTDPEVQAIAFIFILVRTILLPLVAFDFERSYFLKKNVGGKYKWEIICNIEHCWGEAI